MKTTILITIILAIIYYLNKKSSNNHFLKPLKETQKDLDLILKVMESFQFSKDYTERFIIAYSFFQERPEQYNGTSVINDRYTIGGLEVQSVVHGCDWIVARSFKDLHISNVRYANAIRQMNTNFITAWFFIFVGLEIVALFKSLKYIFK